jgi:hypothetical protein
MPSQHAQLELELDLHCLTKIFKLLIIFKTKKGILHNKALPIRNIKRWKL